MTSVTGHNNVRLHVRTAGDAANPAILLIHGWSQSSLSWTHQLQDLSKRFYVIAPDLRGHGTSDKPDAPEAYNSSEPWAEDIAAIIAQMELCQPILVGWSMGGWVLGDYLRLHGDSQIGGAVLIGSSVTTGNKTPDGAALKRDADVIASGMFSDDLSENLSATLKFVRACSHEPLSREDFATAVGFNMLVPPHVRKAARTRHEDYRDTWSKITIPAMVVWGDKERVALPPYIDEALATIPDAKACPIANTGHMPFFEDPTRFNAALTGFADHCTARKDAA